MAPGLNGCQSGTVPKNKAKSSRTRPAGAFAAPNFWSGSEGDRRRYTNLAFLDDSDHSRQSGASTSSTNLVDNDNGELSWGLQQIASESSGSRNHHRGQRSRYNWMSGDQSSGPSSSNHGAGGSGRGVGPPNRQQIINKLANIQDYIEQTESIISQLRASEAAQAQHVNGDGAMDDELDRRTYEHNRKVDALEKQRQELIELQRVAQQKLADAEAERARLLQRASSLNTDVIAGTSLETNLQNLTQRLRNVERLCEDQGRGGGAVGAPVAEQPEEYQIDGEAEGELSDTETDYQLVRDKVAELNRLKAQLSQLQTVMAAIESNPEISDEARRSNPPDLQKVDRMMSQITELNRLAEAVREDRPPIIERPIDSDEISAATMQQMTRDLEEQTARMKGERDRLIQARNDLRNMARQVRGRASSSADDSESEPPSLLPANLTSTPRNVDEDTGSRSGGGKSNESAAFRAPPRMRQRSTWNQSLPTLINPDQMDRRRREQRSSQSSVRNDEAGSGADGAFSSLWAQEMPNSDSLFRTQSQLEESALLCERMLQDSAGRGQGGGGSTASGGNGDLTSLLYSQQQMLIRTVSHCCKLIYLQQRQINELRNTVVLQQSMCPPPAPPQPANQAGAFATVPPCIYPPGPSRNDTAAIHQENLVDNFLGFEEALWPPQNRAAFNPFLQRPRFFNGYAPRPGPSNGGGPETAQPPGSMPPVMPCFSPDEMRPGALNNQVPPGNRANNYWDNFRSYSRQNLLSTPKSNENVDTLRRGIGTRQAAANQDRTPHAIVPPNNQSQNPIGQVQPLRQVSHIVQPINASADANSNHSHVIRSRSAEPQTPRNIGGAAAKNRTCEVVGRRDEAATATGRCRNNAGVRNRTPDPWDVENMDDGLTRVRNNTGRNRFRLDQWEETGIRDDVDESFNNRVRNNTGTRNRTDPWDDGVNRVRNNTGIGARNRAAVDPTPERPPEVPERANLNNQMDSNNLFTVLRLPTSVYQEVANFIRANEARPNFLIQLFRDLQQVQSDPQRQRALQSLQEVVGPNNIVLEARSNIRHDHHSNLNRYTDEAVDQLFVQLRENQNTIRQNIGNASLDSIGNNLENPNISNIRELHTQTSAPSAPPPVGAAAPTAAPPPTRNNNDHNHIRDLQSYFEGNLCHTGPGAALKNPNLSNIRENLTQENVSDYEPPKDVYSDLYDHLVADLRRRSAEEDFLPSFDVDRPPNSYRMYLMDSRPRFDMMGPMGNNIPVCRDFEGPSLGAVRKRDYRFADMNEDRVEEPRESSSMPTEWLPVENSFGMYHRPINRRSGFLEPSTDDADLAEADQTRSSVEAGEAMCIYLNGMTAEADSQLTRELNMEERTAAEDVQASESVVADSAHSQEPDTNENLAPPESNNNMCKGGAGVRNRRDRSNERGPVKVTKTRMQEALCAAETDKPDEERMAAAEGVAENSLPITPIMDIAGSLEHLIDYIRQESSPYRRPEPDSEADAEREIGLDQVPTRLERGECPEKDEPA